MVKSSTVLMRMVISVVVVHYYYQPKNPKLMVSFIRNLTGSNTLDYSALFMA